MTKKQDKIYESEKIIYDKLVNGKFNDKRLHLLHKFNTNTGR